MGMEIKQKPASRTKIPAGLAPAVCIGIYDCGDQPGFGKNAHKTFPTIYLEFELVGTKDDKGNPFIVSQNYFPNFGNNSRLKEHLEGWRAKKFTKEELNGFDIEKLLGVPCQLNIVHNETAGGGLYANIAAILPWAKGAAKIPAKRAKLKFFFNEKQEPDADLPEYWLNKIKAAPQFETYMQTEEEAEGEYAGLDSTPQADAEDDDIPF